MCNPVIECATSRADSDVFNHDRPTSSFFQQKYQKNFEYLCCFQYLVITEMICVLMESVISLFMGCHKLLMLNVPKLKMLLIIFGELLRDFCKVLLELDLSIQIKRIKFRGVTPRRVTSGWARLRGLEPEQLSSEQTSQSRQIVRKTESNLTGPVIEPVPGKDSGIVANSLPVNAATSCINSAINLQFLLCSLPCLCSLMDC